MSTVVNKVSEKLLEYGIKIYNQYPTKNDQYVFWTKHMILFVDNNEDVSISFQATSKPDDVARNILILKEIEEIKHIHLMESFIFTDNRELIHGDEAFDLVRRSIENGAIKDHEKQLMYSSLLTKTDGELYTC